MKVMNTWIYRINYLVTYKSGLAETVFDYILVHCSYQGRVKSVKIILWEEVVSQVVVINISLKKEARHKKKV